MPEIVIIPYDGSAPIDKPGFYDMPAALYHADPCILPSLSHSISKVLLRESAMHAKDEHPRLRDPDDDEEPDETNHAMDFGSAVHKEVLGKGDEIEIINATSYQRKAAKKARDEARAAGKIPILAKNMRRVKKCAAAVERQMRAHPDWRHFLTAPSVSEVVLIWYEEEHGVWCRSMVDRMLLETLRPYDLKSTNLSASPWGWEKRMQEEYATQDAFYRRGITKLAGRTPDTMLFGPFEQKRPYGFSSVDADLVLSQWADDEVEAAIIAWGVHMKSGKWPGFPNVTTHIGARSWQADALETGLTGPGRAPRVMPQDGLAAEYRVAMAGPAVETNVEDF